jgi:hypothetical protein
VSDRDAAASSDGDAVAPASAEDVERAFSDTKLAQVLYHDW